MTWFDATDNISEVDNVLLKFVKHQINVGNISAVLNVVLEL